MRSRLKWLGFWTLLGLISSTQLFLADRRFAAHPFTGWRALAASLSAWYVWGLLAPVVPSLGRRFQVGRPNSRRHFFTHPGRGPARRPPAPGGPPRPTPTNPPP